MAKPPACGFMTSSCFLLTLCFSEARGAHKTVSLGLCPSVTVWCNVGGFASAVAVGSQVPGRGCHGLAHDPEQNTVSQHCRSALSYSRPERWHMKSQWSDM